MLAASVTLKCFLCDLKAMKHSWFEPIREEKEEEAKAKGLKDGLTESAKDEFIEVAHSVHDIKVYSEQAIGDDDDDDDEEEDDGNGKGSNPVTLIKQSSIRDLDQY